ncbi:response regulator [Methanocalculus sp.]|uniref:ATP-binding response regulator n=1 Tax=Methanocalculus sp. TaxID=2004547 RepID=UPI0027232C92|nr:response regulator [Methanocalculus sp.]MDO8841792.1 response regulator [Methanocalculus sp.]
MTGTIRILVVEDEALVAQDLKEMLQGLGYEVPGIAKTGERAIALAGEHQPDLVLMDINLASEMDGITAGGEIRSRWGIPIIYVTAFATQVIIDRAKKTSPAGYILKPFNERQIQTALEIALYNHELEKKVTENERTIRILANAIPDAVMLLDHNQNIIALNDAMVRRLGYNYDQVNADSPVRLDQNGQSTSLESQIGEILRSGQPVRFEEKNQDGCFEISLILIAGAEGQTSQIFVQYHDITDHKRLEEALKKEGRTQIGLNMEQFQILNDQIRNPLQAIMGYVNLDCAQYRENIMVQIKLVDTLVDRLDRGWVESEKVRNFLLRHYQPDFPE